MSVVKGTIWLTMPRVSDAIDIRFVRHQKHLVMILKFRQGNTFPRPIDREDLERWLVTALGAFGSSCEKKILGGTTLKTQSSS